MNNEPKWLVEARKDIGMRELAGAPTAPRIAGWLAELGAWWRDDETPWCGTAVAGWLKASGVPLPKHWYRAKAWLNWGTVLGGPAVGAIVVFERAGGGHVGFLVGKDHEGRLLVLGGNQGDKVGIIAFDRNRVAGYLWPAGVAAPAAGLPLLSIEAALSRNEA